MPRLATHVDTGAPTFRENAKAMQALVDDLTARLERVRRGGGEEAVAKHEGRGKLPARERSKDCSTPGPRSSNSRRSPRRTSTTARPRAPGS